MWTKEDFMDDTGKVSSIETDKNIYGFFGKYRCLSNFHNCQVTYDGLTYNSSEAAYMAQKTLDLEIRKKFTEFTSGMQAKNYGKTVVLRPNWDDKYRIHAMYRVLFAKFSQDMDSLAVLLSTGDKYLEETNWWGDTFWGVSDGKGTNHLGMALMTIRDFVKSK